MLIVNIVMGIVHKWRRNCIMKKSTGGFIGLTFGITALVVGGMALLIYIMSTGENVSAPLSSDSSPISSSYEPSSTEDSSSDSSSNDSSDSSSSLEEHIHDYVTAVTDPTCTEQGYTTYTCSCGDNYVSDYTDELGHELVEHEGTAPTCTGSGLTSYKTCNRCDYSTEQEVIEAKGHNYGEFVVDIDATCTTDGHQYKLCADCGDKVEEPIAALGHDYVEHEGKDPTCTEKGWNAYSVCQRCGDTTYSEIAANGHAYGAFIIDVEATCTTDGHQYKVCAGCGDKVEEAVPALGHDYVDHEAKAATCTDFGWNAYQTCSRCDYSTYSEIAAKGHNYGETVVDVAATCTESGSQHKVCSDCAATVNEEISAMGHDYVRHAAQAATCTEAGWNSYQTCSRCDYTTKVEIPATGHNYVNFVCTKCGIKQTLTDGDSLELGNYPQTCVTDETLISTLAGVNDSDGDGYIEYQGTKYFKALGNGKSCLNQTTGIFTVNYDSSTTYYFEVEPIVWTYYNGILISDKIIDSSRYLDTSVSYTRTIDGSTVRINNYKYSTLRAYLNGYDGSSYEVENYSGKGFIDQAFTSGEQAMIETTTVNNSRSSTSSSTNPYSCADTDDKIFVLSWRELRNSSYGFTTSTGSASSRVKEYTDYALFRGLGIYKSADKTGIWYTRSPVHSSYPDTVSLVGTDGTLNYTYGAYTHVHTVQGVAPCMKIAL